MKKKGFTLIELLAVIVILAIIALIATPMILGVIDKAKKGSAESSALGYIDAVEKASVLSLLDAETAGATTAMAEGVYTVSGATITKGATSITVDVKGTTPTAGWIYVNSEGVVVAAQLDLTTTYAKVIRYTGSRAVADVNTLDAAPTTLADAQSLVATSH